jgi:hypothetical protein
MAANLGGNLGQPQNAVTTIGNIPSATAAVVTVPGHVPQQQTVGTSIDTPLEVESIMQSVGETYFVNKI